MLLYLHPTRHEALTAGATTLTRWSLATDPATILAQSSLAPESVFHRYYAPSSQPLTYGGIVVAPDGMLFVRERFNPHHYHYPDPSVLEWCHWEDFTPTRASPISSSIPELRSLANSSDGHWLVVEDEQRIFLLDWQTGKVLSHHTMGWSSVSGLTFDPTSTYLAGVYTEYTTGCLRIFRLVAAEHFIPRPALEDWRTHELVPQDWVSGRLALTVMHEHLDRTGIAWATGTDLADTVGTAAFSPNSQLVIFSLTSPYSPCGVELVAYEVASGQRRWYARNEAETSGPFVLTPDGRTLLVPVQGSDLLVYRLEDGALLQRLPTGLNEPVQALAYDHDGKTLWLATEEALVPYRPPG
jgi:hypothetical protein